MHRFIALTLSACTLLGATTARAESAMQRMINLGRYAGQAGYCQAIGFQVHADASERYADLAIAEGVKGGFSEDTSASYILSARDAAASQTQQGLSSLLDTRQTSGEAFANRVRNEMRTWTATCRKIAQDPIGRVLVTDSPLSDEILVRDAADGALWKGGWASWQTPYIRAAGDLAYAVSACGKYLNRPQTNTYMAPLRAPDAFPASVRDQAQRYVNLWVSMGEHEVEDGGFNATECKSLVPQRAAQLKAAPR